MKELNYAEQVLMTAGLKLTLHTRGFCESAKDLLDNSKVSSYSEYCSKIEKQDHEGKWSTIWEETV